MVDVAKVTYLALVLVVSAFCFETKVFEFLDASRVYGFPEIMGVLTHEDSFKSTKSPQRFISVMRHHPLK